MNSPTLYEIERTALLIPCQTVMRRRRVVVTTSVVLRFVQRMCRAFCWQKRSSPQ